VSDFQTSGLRADEQTRVVFSISLAEPWAQKEKKESEQVSTGSNQLACGKTRSHSQMWSGLLDEALPEMGGKKSVSTVWGRAPIGESQKTLRGREASRGVFEKTGLIRCGGNRGAEEG